MTDAATRRTEEEWVLEILRCLPDQERDILVRVAFALGHAAHRRSQAPPSAA